MSFDDRSLAAFVERSMLRMQADAPEAYTRLAEAFVGIVQLTVDAEHVWIDAAPVLGVRRKGPKTCATITTSRPSIRRLASGQTTLLAEIVSNSIRVRCDPAAAPKLFTSFQLFIEGNVRVADSATLLDAFLDTQGSTPTEHTLPSQRSQ